MNSKKDKKIINNKQRGDFVRDNSNDGDLSEDGTDSNQRGIIKVKFSEFRQ